MFSRDILQVSWQAESHRVIILWQNESFSQSFGRNKPIGLPVRTSAGSRGSARAQRPETATCRPHPRPTGASLTVTIFQNPACIMHEISLKDSPQSHYKFKFAIRYHTFFCYVFLPPPRVHKHRLLEWKPIVLINLKG